MVLACFKVLSWHLPGRTEENHDNINEDSQCPNRNLKQAPPKCKSEALSPITIFPVSKIMKLKNLREFLIVHAVFIQVVKNVPFFKSLEAYHCYKCLPLDLSLLQSFRTYSLTST
jgi:hypothetical protein